MPPIKDGKVFPLREETLLSVSEGTRHGDRRLYYLHNHSEPPATFMEYMPSFSVFPLVFTPFLQQNRQSLSPFPPRCYRQSTDNQIVLQGGNGDKGFKNYV